MNMKKCLIVYFIILGLIFGCEGKKKPETASRPAISETDRSASNDGVDVIRLAGGDWGYPTPYAHYPRGPGGFKMCLIFDSLLERDENGLIPWLAESWQVSEDGKTIEFTVREGVKWHDGTVFTAEDVKFSIEYASAHPMTWSYIFKEIESVEIRENRRVRVAISKPSAAMLYNIGITRMLPRHIWETVDRPKEFVAPEAVIGTGPYRLTDYSKAQGTYRFEAFEGFWGPRPRIRRIEYIPVSQEILAFEKGEIDMTGVPPDVLYRFRDNPEYKIVKSPAFWGYRLMFNMENQPILKDKRMRRAFLYAVDLKELVEKIARKAAVPGNPGILPPDHVMYNPAVKAYDHNPESARTLLTELGYTLKNDSDIRENDAGESLRFHLICGSQEVRMAEIIRERLHDVGIALEVQSMDYKSRDSRVRRFEFEIAILGHGGWGADPDYLKTRFMGRSADGSLSPSSSGLPGYENPRLNDLFERQHTEIDPVKRKKLIAQIQEILAEELPEIPLFYTTGYTVYRPGKYDGWMFMYDHHSLTHGKLSFLERESPNRK